MTFRKLNTVALSAIAIFILNVAITSCNSSGSKQSLIGTWENVSLTVGIETQNGSNSSSQLIVNKGEWEKIMKIQPIKTTYLPDGKFTSSYYALDGSPLGKEEGKWFIRNDSLILESTNYSNSYALKFKGNTAQFISKLDWDQDGENDDLYDGWQRKID